MNATQPKLDGVIETCLYADDLDRAARFYEEVLRLPLMTADSRFRAYDVGGRSVLLIFRRGATRETVHMPEGTIPPHGGQGDLHIAFAIAADELPDWEKRLTAHGIPIEGRAKMDPRRREHLFPRSGSTPPGTGHAGTLGDLLRAGLKPAPTGNAADDLQGGNFAIMLGATSEEKNG